MRPTLYTLLNEERANDLEAIAPARLKALEALKTMRKKRIDARTEILIPINK